jgi:hypothetical protein
MDDEARSRRRPILLPAPGRHAGAELAPRRRTKPRPQRTAALAASAPQARRHTLPLPRAPSCLLLAAPPPALSSSYSEADERKREEKIEIMKGKREKKEKKENVWVGVGKIRPNRRTEPKRPRPKRPRPRNSVSSSVPTIERPNLFRSFRLLGSVNRINRENRIEAQ